MLRFAGEIGATTFAAVFATLAILRAAPAPGWIDLMPGYASILIVIDPLVTTPAASARLVRQRLRAARPAIAPRDPRPRRHLEIPVLYHADVAPDLLALAAEKALPVPALIERHSQPVYRCHMLGFRPGFPFLGGLDPRLATPRLATPRLSVPAGSVAVAGQQTGIYPSAGPGGWRIIGRTPLRLFDHTRPDPFLVHAGDQVTFVPIDEAQFAALAQREMRAA
jgi:KipI family sensor histidine kinase inhibitor